MWLITGSMLNDDGRCYSFDSRGSGYGRSEGVATVILKRLDDALRDGDPIRAVIRNSGVNSDGRTNGTWLWNAPIPLEYVHAGKLTLKPRAQVFFYLLLLLRKA